MSGQAYQARDFFLILVAALFFSSASCRAQATAPSLVTPQNLRPVSGPQDQGIALPSPAASAIPAGADKLTVAIGEVRVEGGFAELSAAAEEWTHAMAGRRMTIAQIYAGTAALERLYSEAGFPLARVVVPPQNLVDRGRLRILVIDGFIEAVDVAGVPERVRGVVAARTDALVNRRHITLARIERALLVAGDIAGLRLRSALLRGQKEGGVRLTLEGEHRLVTGSAGGDDMLTSSLGAWQLRGSVAVNSAAGFGEQVYATVGMGANIPAAVEGAAPLMVYGGGVVLPVGVDGVTVNPEFTHSTTRTAQSAAAPASTGVFERFAMRLRDPLILTRKQSLYVTVAIEQVSEQLNAPQYATTLNRDSYWVARAGTDYATTLRWGQGLQTGAILSQGLGGRSASEAEASGVPLSRMGSSPEFTKIAGNIKLSQPLPDGLRLDIIASGQTSMDKPLMREEQIALDGGDAISAFAAGVLVADQAAILRGEVARPVAVNFGDIKGGVSPYIFGVLGRGWLAEPSAAEQSAMKAGALGVGARGNLQMTNNAPVTNLGLEMGRGYTDVAGVRQGWRANVIASVVY